MMTKSKLSLWVASAAMMSSALCYGSENPLSFSASVGIEYDDNITVSALDTTTGESDEALVVDFSATYTALERDGMELELSYDLYQSIYDTQNDFDLQIHTLSALGSWEVNDIDLGLYYGYSSVDLGDDDLYSSHTLTPSVALSLAENWYNRFSYSLVSKDFDSVAGRDADQHGLATDNYLFFMDNAAYIVLGARVEVEDAKDNELDYQALYLSASVSMPLSYGDHKLADFKGAYQRYWRDYDNVTASIGKKRDDEQDKISLAFVRPINDTFDLVLSYEYTNTESNLSSVEAEGNVVTLSVAADF